MVDRPGTAPCLRGIATDVTMAAMNPSDRATRRAFLRGSGGLLGAGLLTAVLEPGASARLDPMLRRVGRRPAGDLARDEDFWFQVQQAFTVDRSLINLNNGGVSPAPGVAMEALRRFDEYANHAPAYTMWRQLKPEYELVRERLARLFGCDREEVAITRNATESLDNVIFGLELNRGDEALTTEQDYPSMLAALHQRELREGIVVKKLAVPTPAPSAQALIDLFAEAIGERTRAILVSHVVNITGQIFPIRGICDLARPLGIEVIVDGAHSFAHFPFDRDELGCDYFGTSLHKWLCAPVGAGMLSVRKDKVDTVWPLFGQGEPRSDDIRKFEQVGTHPASHRLAISEAITFHESIGTERKAARLRYLRDRWADRFRDDPRVTFHAGLNDQDSCAIATVGVEGIEPTEVGKALLTKSRVVVTAISPKKKAVGVSGIRVTPSVYTTVREIDIFADALAEIVENGV